MAFLLRESRDLTQLSWLINRIGKFNLIEMKNATLKDYVAWVVVGGQMRQIPVPRGLKSRKVAVKTVRRKLDEIKESLEQRLALCSWSTKLTRTPCVMRFRAMAEHDLRVLANARKRCRSNAERLALANQMIARIRFEYRYNWPLTRKRTGTEAKVLHFTAEQIQTLSALCRQIPEGRLILTPRLRELQKVGVKPDFLGKRLCRGLIQVSDSAIGDREISKQFGGQPSLAVVTCHEYGHSIKFGASDGISERERHLSEAVMDTDPLYEFEDFAALSEWTVIERDRFKLENNRQRVRLDGVQYRLDVPIIHDGKRITLWYDSDTATLFSYNSDAQFPADENSRTAPWEDWAESFTAYVLCPRQLIQFAPYKFLDFEQHFRKYHHDQDLKDLVQRTIRASSALEQRQERKPGLKVSFRRDHDGVHNLVFTCFGRDGQEIGPIVFVPPADETRARALPNILNATDRALKKKPSASEMVTAISRLREALSNAEKSHTAVVSPMGKTNADILATSVEKIMGSLSVQEARSLMSVKQEYPGIYHLRMPLEQVLAASLLRVQEHFESPHFRGKVFTLDEFKKWYTEGQGHGAFSYYEDWAGFNFPDVALAPFLSGELAPLSVAEQAFLELFKDVPPPYYVIGTATESSLEYERHELAHAFYYLNPEYRGEVQKVLAEYDTAELKTWLEKIGYHGDVLEDEVQAYLIDGLAPLREEGIKTAPLRGAPSALRSLLKSYMSRSRG
jgi:hypothetical protein